MANNQLQWNNIQPNFIGSNQATAVGSQMLSSAGDIFSKTAEYTQKEAVRLSQERDKLFESAGKELSNLALQEGMEATVLSDGSVRHTFNSEKYDQAVSKYATEKGYDRLDEDARAKIWASLNVNTDYQLGLANNQANAQNTIDRARLGLEGRKLAQQDKILNEGLFADVRDLYVNYVLNPNATPEDRERVKEAVVDAMNRVTNKAEKAYLSTMKDLTDNPQKVEEYLYTSKDKTTIDNYEGIQNLYTRIGGSTKDMENNPVIQNLKGQYVKNKEKIEFIDSINNGTYGINLINGIKTTNKITALDTKSQEEDLGRLINIYAFSLANNPEMTVEKIQSATNSWLNNILNITKDKEGNVKGSFKLNSEEVLDDLIQGNYTSSGIKKIFGQLSVEQFNQLSKTAQLLTNIPMNTKPDKNNRSLPKESNTLPTGKDIAQEKAVSLSEKHGFTVKNMNNIDENLFRNSVTKIDSAISKVKEVRSDDYSKVLYHINNRNKDQFKTINFEDLPPKFSEQLQLIANTSESSLYGAYALNIILMDPSFREYKRNVTNYVKSKFTDDTLKTKINDYQNNFLKSYENLFNILKESQQTHIGNIMREEAKRQQNESEYYGVNNGK